MSDKVWGIKLGSGGSCVPFCEQHDIVGVGWESVDAALVSSGTWDALRDRLDQAYQTLYQGNRRKLGNAVGTLHRFGQQCSKGDYVLYYDPRQMHVRVCKVTSGPQYRNFELTDPTDIWHYREVEWVGKPLPLIDLHGGIKASVYGLKPTFWDMSRWFDVVEQLTRGQVPALVAAAYDEVSKAYEDLRSLVVKQAEALNDKEWEWLVADYLTAQGADVDEKVGGNRPIIDAEARFDHGELPGEVWRVQVKRWQGRQVDWPDIEPDLERIGEAQFCYVSVFGFTTTARDKAESEGVVLLEAGDFTRFLLSGKLRLSLRKKLRLPFSSVA